MPEKETGYFLGDGGTVWEMDLPLPDVMAEKFTKGYLQRVNADGTPYVPPAADSGAPAVPVQLQRPAQSAPKAEWVGWAVHNGMTPDDAEALTKVDLIERYGNREPARPAPATPAAPAEPSAPPQD